MGSRRLGHAARRVAPAPAPLEPPDVWISDGAGERFGVIAFGDLPDLQPLRELIGKEPEIGEEFEVVERSDA